MEMPVDVLNKYLTEIQDAGANIDPGSCAADIDTELQRKFYFIPKEEVEAVDIEKNTTHLHIDFEAGSGPAAIRAAKDDNPAWLYQSAVHALAMYQHLKAEQERPKIPEPGVYMVFTPLRKASTVIVTEDRRAIVPNNVSGSLLDRTDELTTPNSSFEWQRIDTATGTLTT